MKKNALSLAVASGVAALTMASAQAAMYLNPEGTGQVLLYPFYDAENGNSTAMHIVNTTDKVKAVKVRFLEYKASYEVLDFNLYLSPKDHFSFAVITDPNGTGGAIRTTDNSCTVPALGSANGDFTGTTVTEGGVTTRTQPFVNYEFLKSKVGGVSVPFVDSDVSRTLRGHVEVIEMGVVNDRVPGANPPLPSTLAAQYASFATHDAAGMPANCAGLDKAFASGEWAANPEKEMTAPTGGLYGLAYHLNLEDAAAWGFEPAAIADWSDAEVHALPGSEDPNLGMGTDQAIIVEGGAATTLDFANNGFDAVSSLFMTDKIMNDVMLNSTIGGQTDWVTTFPTKRHYVTNLYDKANPVKEPFTSAYDGVYLNSAGTQYLEKRSCEPVSAVNVDREEAAVSAGNNFSPKPPGAAGNVLCDEQNVVAWGAGATSALGVTRDLSSLGFAYTEGWSTWSFGNTKQLCGKDATDSDTVCLAGLPAMGFAAYKYVNGSTGSVLMNYGHAADHKTNVNGSGLVATGGSK